MLLHIDNADLERIGAQHTAREIAQQPETLRAIQKQLEQENLRLSKFLMPLMTRPDMRIILTGAGTSAFIGSCLAPLLKQKLACRLEAIATTDIVSNPSHYLERETPTLLISFGRSGNSPESIAAVDIFNQCVAECHHFAIGCNADGALSHAISAARYGYALVLPEATHDQSFAMTSSFTGMMYAALACLTGISNMSGRIDSIVASVDNMIENNARLMQNLARDGFDRVVFLGSHSFKGLAQEAALKLLELSDGDVVAVHESSLGFRHGPKAIVNEKTMIMLFVSNDPYTRQYDLDLLAEIKRDAKARHIVAIAARFDERLGEDHVIKVHGLENADDCDLLFPYIIAPQMFAFYQSILLGKSPDNPNAAGLVNRVVKGVSIHAFPES
jgi:tagatose-6-phosphate ketose/aldose isomerase